jgi:mono/diheme cytochrome c family protein
LRRRRTLAAALLVVASVVACSDSREPAAAADPAVERGRVVYMSICIACHNADPNLDGSLGPANAGSSRALLEAKLLRGEYPPGYRPKRPSRLMPRFENLAGSIDDLAAFLAAAKRVE